MDTSVKSKVRWERQKVDFQFKDEEMNLSSSPPIHCHRVGGAWGGEASGPTPDWLLSDSDGVPRHNKSVRLY